MLDYDNHILFLSFVLQPNDVFRGYYAQNVIGFEMGTVIYTDVYTYAKIHRYKTFEKRLYSVAARGWRPYLY